MPTYQYHYTACGKELGAVQKFFDSALTTCPACSSDLRKVYSTVGVVFRGFGFYVTNSRRPTSASKPASGSETKTDSAPAKSTETVKAAF